MPDQPTEIYAAATPFEAHELKNLLAEEDIEAIVVNDVLQAAAGDLPLGWVTAARVLVAEQDAERAREIAEEFDRQMVAARRDRRAERDEPRASPVSYAVCPRCGRPRTAVCPICQTAGANFLSGDLPAGEEAGGEPQLLICPICDEPFEPGYLPRCEWCGHEFVHEALPPEAEETESEVEPPNRRVIAAAVGMIAVIAAVFGYFVWLFR